MNLGKKLVQHLATVDAAGPRPRYQTRLDFFVRSHHVRRVEQQHVYLAAKPVLQAAHQARVHDVQAADTVRRPSLDANACRQRVNIGHEERRRAPQQPPQCGREAAASAANF
eukprot:CAMPEP_0203755182 /NCGR_PEP_ID=MMETSP0098-20131031/8672_1 /ASSEMBLY_ACC=CAM_ASM_000208 /TAXON_ID=96639 /ORGANISM=" , Strain NY0313808BC1" /LENGTH=111 /DNA_ID=CAMNT_0050646533 /DNA_START=131 /DNA_END=466 /DNA_ORIENTATION=-